MKEVGFFNKVEIPSTPPESGKRNLKQKAGTLLGKCVEWYFDFGQASYKPINKTYGNCPVVIKNEQKRSIFKIILKVIECSIKVLLSPILILPMLIGKIYFRYKNTFLIDPTATFANLSQKAANEAKKLKENTPTPEQTKNDPSLQFPKSIPPNYDIKNEVMAHPLMKKISIAATQENGLDKKLKGTLKTIFKEERYADKHEKMNRVQAQEIFYILTRRYEKANGFIDENKFSKEIAAGKKYILDPYVEYEGTASPQRMIDDINKVKNDSPNVTSIPLYLSIQDPNTKAAHSTLVFADLEKGTLEYYDSSQNYGNHDAICANLQVVADSLGLEFKKKVNKQIEQGNFSSGFWTCYFLKKRLEDPNFDPDKIENSQNLERQIRLEFTLMRILYNLELKDEKIKKHATPAAYATKMMRNKNYFEMFEEFHLRILSGKVVIPN